MSQGTRASPLRLSRCSQRSEGARLPSGRPVPLHEDHADGRRCRPHALPQAPQAWIPRLARSTSVSISSGPSPVACMRAPFTHRAQVLPEHAGFGRSCAGGRERRVAIAHSTRAPSRRPGHPSRSCQPPQQYQTTSSPHARRLQPQRLPALPVAAESAATGRACTVRGERSAGGCAAPNPAPCSPPRRTRPARGADRCLSTRAVNPAPLNVGLASAFRRAVPPPPPNTPHEHPPASTTRHRRPRRRRRARRGRDSAGRSGRASRGNLPPRGRERGREGAHFPLPAPPRAVCAPVPAAAPRARVPKPQTQTQNQTPTN